MHPLPRLFVDPFLRLLSGARWLALLALISPAFASAVTTMEAGAAHTMALETDGKVMAGGDSNERERKIQTYVDAIKASGIQNHTQTLHLINSLESRLKQFSATESDSQQVANQTILMDVFRPKKTTQ